MTFTKPTDFPRFITIGESSYFGQSGFSMVFSPKCSLEHEMPGYHPRKDTVFKKKKNHIQQKNKFYLFIYHLSL